MQIKHLVSGTPGPQYGYAYLARRDGISCVEARAVLEAAGSSRAKATYFAEVLLRLARPSGADVSDRVAAFKAWVEKPII